MITPATILIGSLIGALVAVHSVRHHREIARKRATLDLISEREWERDAIDIRNEFVKIRQSDGGLAAWADPTFLETPQVATICSVLNEYELMAVGIREEILDEELYRRWYKSSYLRDWNQAREFVRRIREVDGRQQALFSEFEWLACKWGGTPVSQPSTSSTQA